MHIHNRLNGQGRLSAEPTQDAVKLYSYSNGGPPSDGTTRDIPSEGLMSSLQARSLKRNRMHEEDDSSSSPKRQLSLPVAPSSSPFQTLRVTKSSISNRFSLSKLEEEPSTYYDTNQGRVAGPRYSLGQTTVEQLAHCSIQGRQEYVKQRNGNTISGLSNGSEVIDTPHLAARHRAAPVATAYTPRSIVYSQNSSHYSPTYHAVSKDKSLCNNANGANQFTDRIPGSDSLKAVAGIDAQDEYPLDDDLMEEAMACLLDAAPGNVQETHIPPSSVAQAWDHDSRSAVEFDSTLQYSPPEELSSQSMNVTEGSGNTQDDLLDEDVDWNAVFSMISTVPRDPSISGLQETIDTPLQVRITHTEEAIERPPRAKDVTPLKPFVRPPFPQKVRDRSAVSGLSPQMVLRTCFRIGELINQAAHCLCHQQEVVFELFARVTYSNRESLQKNQHFQFIDLFKDQRPYPAGILTNWRVGTLLDRQSAAFLGTSAGPKTCRCVCTPRKDSRVAIGLSLVVLAIREIGWEEVRLAKKIVCGGSDDAA